MKNIFEECLGNFIHLDYPRWFQILETFYKLEKEINDWKLISYFYDEANHELLFQKDNFKFQYNLILLNGVVKILNEDFESEFYNLENIPPSFNRFWLDIILNIIKI